MCASAVWEMIHGCTVTATYQPEERQRHRGSSSVIFTLPHERTHTGKRQHLTFVRGTCARLFSAPGGTPVEMVDDVTTPWPAAVTAATWIVYTVVEVRPVSWQRSVELDKERSSRLDLTLGISHHTM